ncbi:DUF3108 domain-containing protein [Ramlibacter sp.]|uniref:DUF3108 domain-containing protein n=1 Tax=Ramlibacter sp. TaxID=1917967 RepID=UPI002D356C5D|nr:DUF3108 domain-containing protein [Ramlibacter sp.]HYD77891.1 DUF3108 domain-containing protein [Ramlibacter sp.]
MAGGADLNPAGRRRLLALVAVVLLAHVLALHALSLWLSPGSLLRPMAEPMYTRLLQPETPAPPPVAAAAVVVPPPAPPKRMQAAPSVPRRVTRTAAAPKPEPVAPEPEPPIPVAEPEPPPVPEPAAEPAPEPEQAVAQAEPAAPEAASPTPAASAPAAAASEPASSPVAGPALASGETTSPLDGWPADTRLRYTLGGRFRSGDLYGEARVLWQRQGSRYQVRVEVDVTLFATVLLTSQGEVGPQTLHPRAYEEVRNLKSRGLLRMDESEVTLPNGKVLPRPPQMQDTASQFVDLSHRFASGLEPLEVGRAVSFWMARPGAVDLWTYDIVGKEVLATALGDVEAFHLKPRPIANPRGNITVEMWFAPALQYLPVRVKVNMGEEAHVDLLVEGIEQR